MSDRPTKYRKCSRCGEEGVLLCAKCYSELSCNNKSEPLQNILRNRVHGSVKETVCLVGSVKQEKDWRDWTAQLTARGYVVFEAGVYGTLDQDIPTETWDAVTHVHFKKIQLSDLVLVIPKPDGTIGKHTQEDIDYARKLGKPVQNVTDFWIALRIDSGY